MILSVSLDKRKMLYDGILDWAAGHRLLYPDEDVPRAGALRHPSRAQLTAGWLRLCYHHYHSCCICLSQYDRLIKLI